MNSYRNTRPLTSTISCSFTLRKPSLVQSERNDGFSYRFEEKSIHSVTIFALFILHNSSNEKRNKKQSLIFFYILIFLKYFEHFLIRCFTFKFSREREGNTQTRPRSRNCSPQLSFRLFIRFGNTYFQFQPRLISATRKGESRHFSHKKSAKFALPVRASPLSSRAQRQEEAPEKGVEYGGVDRHGKIYSSQLPLEINKSHATRSRCAPTTAAIRVQGTLSFDISLLPSRTLSQEKPSRGVPPSLIKIYRDQDETL